MRGATRFGSVIGNRPCISIHAPHAGRDEWKNGRKQRTQNFNPRAPCGARLFRQGGDADEDQISIHAPHAGRDQGREEQGGRKGISIHAPHAGRDTASTADTIAAIISIHAPHAGRDERITQEGKV